jgi:hypothetical protein
MDANALLDPRAIREWVEARAPIRPARSAQSVTAVEATLVRPPADFRQARLTVSPLASATEITWIDPAGYEVARSAKPVAWDDNLSGYQFALDVASATVSGEPYQLHV